MKSLLVTIIIADVAAVAIITVAKLAQPHVSEWWRIRKLKAAMASMKVSA